MNDPSPTVASSSNTKILMSASAVVLGLLGFGALLFPHEVLAALGVPPVSAAAVLVEVSGTAYLGFAMLDWMAREKLIGGIYSRPVAIGNFMHFFAGTIVLIQHVVATPSAGVGAVTGAYALLAVGFGYVAFGSGGSCG